MVDHMKFKEFLVDLTKQKNCKSIAELFKTLGGERKLGITLRTFRAVYGGQIPPSHNFFTALFTDLPNHLRKDALVAYFDSSTENPKEREQITDYLSERLTVQISEEIQSLWQKREPQLFSEKQLQFLSSSNEVVRIYNRIICHAGTDHSEMTTPDQKLILKKLTELGIIQVENGRFTPAKTLFRLPHQDNSPRELVVPATEFILRHLNAFIAKEGAPQQQELGFSFHTCLKRDAEKILEQMKYFKRWVQNFGLTEDHPDEVSFVWIDFGRILQKNRDY